MQRQAFFPSPGILRYRPPPRHLDPKMPLPHWEADSATEVTGEQWGWKASEGTAPPEVSVLHVAVNNATPSLLKRVKGNFGLWERPIMQMQAEASFLKCTYLTKASRVFGH